MRIVEQFGLVNNCGRLIDREEAKLRLRPVPVALARVVDRGDIDRRHRGIVDVVAIAHVPIPAFVIIVPVWRRCIDHTFEKVQLVGNWLDPICVLQFALVLAANEVLVLRRQVLFLRHLEVQLSVDNGK